MFGEHLEGACAASEGLCGPRPHLPAASLHLPGARQPLPGPGPISGRSASSPHLRALHILAPADPLSLQGRALSSAEKPTMPPLLTHNLNSHLPRQSRPSCACITLLTSGGRRGSVLPDTATPTISHSLILCPRPNLSRLPSPWRFHCPRGLVLSAAPQPAFPTDVFAPPSVLKVRRLKGRICVCCPFSLPT